MMNYQAKFNDVIGRISDTQAALNGDIHSACVYAIGHAMFHGDVTLGTRLLDATKGSDRKGIAIYLVKFGPFSATSDGFKLNKKFRNEHQFDEQALLEGVKWFEFVPSTKQVMASFDVAKRIQGVLKQAQDKLAEGKEVENAEVTRYIEAAIKEYNRDRAEALRKLAEGGSSNDEASDVGDVQSPAPISLAA